jgi:hypothetical protein
VFGREVAISHCHPQILVPQEGLNGPRVGPSHYQMAGKGMSQVMEPEIFDSCPFTGTPKGHSYHIAVDVRENHFRIRIDKEEGLESREKGFVHGDDSPFVIFNVSFEDDSAFLKINILPVKAQEFPPPHAGMDGNLNDGLKIDVNEL